MDDLHSFYTNHFFLNKYTSFKLIIKTNREYQDIIKRFFFLNKVEGLKVENWSKTGSNIRATEARSKNYDSFSKGK